MPPHLVECQCPSVHIPAGSECEVSPPLQVSASGLTEQDVKPGLASPGWPLLVYLATVVTAPYIIWKLVRRTT